MDEQKRVIDKLKHLQQLLDQNDDLVDSQVRNIRNEYLTNSADDVTAHLQRLRDKNRELKVGIIGRVKAGKSSLINSLIFDGKDILPKAATPMTAALTSIGYAESIEVRVEFYTSADIETIGSKKRHYDRLFQQESEKERKAQEQRHARRYRGAAGYPADTDIPFVLDEEKLVKTVTRTLSQTEPTLDAAAQLYQKITSSSVPVDDLPADKVLRAPSLEALRDELMQYVGAAGDYMPFTKMLHIALPEPALENLEVIDTPGLNDAVASREQRTYQMLKECNVVFIVSPSAQFMSDQDLDLASRLTKREGVQEIFVVASQVDNQLHSSERRKHNGDLHAIMSGIQATYARLTTEALQKQNNGVLREIAGEQNRRLFLSSGVCQTLLRQPEAQWDDNARTANKNLLKNYPQYFTDHAERAKNLVFLSGTEHLEGCVAEVRAQKNRIQKEQEQGFLRTQESSIASCVSDLKSLFQEKKRELQVTDIDEVAGKLATIRETRLVGSRYANEVLAEELKEMSFELSDKLKAHLRKFASDTKEGINASEKTVSESYRRKSDGILSAVGRFFGAGGYETRHRDVTKVKAAEVRDVLEELRLFIEDGLLICVESQLHSWRAKLYRELSTTLREVLGDESIDPSRLKSACRSAINKADSIDPPSLPALPDELAQSGTLKDGEAERFMAEAHEYYLGLKQAGNNYVKSIRYDIQVIGELDMGAEIFNTLEEDATVLKAQLDNKHATLEKLDVLCRDLEEMAG